MKAKSQPLIPLGLVLSCMILISTAIQVGFADGWKPRDLWSLTAIAFSGVLLAGYFIRRHRQIRL